MTRFKITIEYDGGPFVGWQRQDNGPSVQQALEEAVFKFSGEKVRMYGAGRTDAGVHALGQVAHFDLAKAMTAKKMREAVNAHLRPDPVAVVRAETVDDKFNARTSARKRTYLYRIVNRRTPLTIDRGRVWLVTAPLDAAAMHDAAQVLIGKHDFTSFRAAPCQARSPVKTLDLLAVERVGEEIRIHAEARSFLHHQVRNINGTLKMVGEGKWSKADVAAALAARDRKAGGPTAPPDGLYLTGVGYAEGT